MGLAILNSKNSGIHFGLDIGQNSLKLMQIESPPGKPPKVIGFGLSDFYKVEAIKNGEIVDQKAIAKALNDTIDNRLTGAITTTNVACTLPTSRTFSRPIRLPKLSKAEIEEAIQLETEQYIPLPPDKLYIDYEIISKDDQNTELLVVAAPRSLVDSYMNFLAAIGLQPVALEPTMNATARLYNLVDPTHEKPTIMIDLGSVATDIAVFDKTMFVNSTLQGGSDTITDMVSKKFGVSSEEALAIKNKEGIAYSDQLRDIVPVIKPMLDELIREIKRIVRYYNERVGASKKIETVVTTGGGATLKGLSDYLSAELKLPIHMLDPWDKINFGKLNPPPEMLKSVYLTAAGVAILQPKELNT